MKRVDLQRRRVMNAGIGLAAAASGALLLHRTAGAQSPPRTIAIVAKKFDFVPGEIALKRGETVLLQLTAPEVPMGFSLPDFQLRTDVVPGKLAELKFTPDKAGTFIFYCDVFCGSGHEDMSGTLVVT